MAKANQRGAGEGETPIDMDKLYNARGEENPTSGDGRSFTDTEQQLDLAIRCSVAEANLAECIRTRSIYIWRMNVLFKESVDLGPLGKISAKWVAEVLAGVYDYQRQTDVEKVRPKMGGT